MGWKDAPIVDLPQTAPKQSTAKSWKTAPVVGAQKPTTAPLGPRRPMQGPQPFIGPVTGETGKLSDPRQDQEAWIRAKGQDGLAQARLTGRFGETIDAATEGFFMNADRPLAGAISAISGNGYDMGKAVDAYADDMRAERLGGVGTAAGIVGSVLSPSPAGKQKLLIEALQGGAQAGIEGQNLATEGDNRNIGDIVKDVAIGTGVTGALSGVGRALKPAELIDTPKAQRELNAAIQKTLADQDIGRVETSGLALRDALVKEQGALKAAGKDAMKKGVAGDFAVLDDAGSSFMNDVDKAYGAISDAPIAINAQATPAASAFRDQIAIESGKGGPMSLAQIDALRVKARGLRTSAANATDKKALDNLEKSIDQMVNTKVQAGAFVGDEAYNKSYREGRAKYEQAMKISDLPKVRQILKDDTIPGAAIADSLLSINSSSKSKSPAKLAAVITETLGEGSESLDAVRKGTLATMFEGADASPEAQARLLKTLERNETLIGELFTPDQVSELASIRADLTNAATAKDSAAAAAKVESRIKSFLTQAANTAGRVLKNPVGTGASTGMVTGSAATGMSVAGAITALNMAASRPARAAVSAVTDVGAKTAGRQAAQSKEIDAAIPNPRDVLINQLGAQ